MESSEQKTPKWKILKNLSTTSNGYLIIIEQKKFILNGMRHKVLDRKNGNADTIKMEFFATESKFGSGKKRLFFLQLNQPDVSHNYWVSHGVEVFLTNLPMTLNLPSPKMIANWIYLGRFTCKRIIHQVYGIF